MTLTQLATFLCTKVNQSEANDIAACKTFLQRRMDMIWQEELWKDSLIMFQSAISSTGAGLSSALWLPSRSTFVCPSIVERVVAVRTADVRLKAARPEAYFRMDMDAFNQTGTPYEFHLLSPVVYEWDTPAAAQVECDSGDEGASVTFAYLDTDDLTVLQDDFTLIDRPLDIATTLRIDKFTKLATEGDVSLCITNGPFVTQLVVLSAEDTTAPLRQRFRLVGAPSTSTTLRILAKRTMPTFSGNNDSPPLPGIENCLLAYAQADMLERERQYGKAQACVQEAQALLDQFKKVEVVQQSHSIRIIPEDGYGNPYDLWSHPPLSF